MKTPKNKSVFTKRLLTTILLLFIFAIAKSQCADVDCWLNQLYQGGIRPVYLVTNSNYEPTGFDDLTVYNWNDGFTTGYPTDTTTIYPPSAYPKNFLDSLGSVVFDPTDSAGSRRYGYRLDYSKYVGGNLSYIYINGYFITRNCDRYPVLNRVALLTLYQSISYSGYGGSYSSLSPYKKMIIAKVMGWYINNSAPDTSDYKNALDTTKIYQPNLPPAFYNSTYRQNECTSLNGLYDYFNEFGNEYILGTTDFDLYIYNNCTSGNYVFDVDTYIATPRAIGFPYISFVNYPEIDYTFNPDSSYIALTDSSFTPPTLTTTPANLTCSYSANGSVNLAVSGSTSPYSYSWSNSTSAQNIGSVVAGTYYVTVTDNNGCTVGASQAVTVPDSIAISSTITNATCEGLTDGGIALTITGGTGSFTSAYSWGTESGGEFLSGLAAGIYSVTVTDANGCTAVLVEQEVKNTSTFEIEDTIINVNCDSTHNGAVNLTITTGDGPSYSYAWSSGATTKNISGLTEGIYSLTITGEHGCLGYVNAQVDSCPAMRMESALPNKSIAPTEILVYPNPTNGNINITYNISQPGTVNVDDLTGRTLKTFRLDENRQFETFNLNDLQDGIYLCRVSAGSRQIKTTKIVLIKQN